MALSPASAITPNPVPTGWRWLPPMAMGGAWQMAIDGGLLAAALAAGPQALPVLRFYTWSRPTLSLGYHQRLVPQLWWDLVDAGQLELVRRPSGGRAVLHGGTLTYALVWPDPPARPEAYGLACGWLQEAFAALGQPLQFGQQPSRSAPASCFATSTAADLVHADGTKRIGSAQLWRGGALLQHGTILIEPPADLWQQIFGMPPPPLPPLPLQGDALVEHLAAAAGRFLPALTGPRREQAPAAAEWAEWATHLGRYRLERGPSPPTSPADTIARAT